MKFLIIAALVAVSVAAPQQYAYQQRQPFEYRKPSVLTTITKTVSKPYSTIARSDTTVVEAAQPQYTQQPQYEAQQPQYETQQPQYTPAKPSAHPVIAIVKLERNQEPSGDYSFFYQSENGIQASEKAVIKPVRDEKNEEHFVPNVEGSYSYTGPDGVQYTVNYVADEFGYRASGAHLPSPNQA